VCSLWSCAHRTSLLSLWCLLRTGVGSVVSLIVSAEFLMMDELLAECVRFVHDHFAAVLTAPVDMRCLGPSVVASIARTFTLPELVALSVRLSRVEVLWVVVTCSQRMTPGAWCTCAHDRMLAAGCCLVCTITAWRSCSRTPRCSCVPA
jgi:hypothetical protein